MFIIGLPISILYLESLFELNKIWLKRIIFLFIAFIFLSDNASWFLIQSYKRGSYISISKNQQDVFDFLGKNYLKNELLISEDHDIGYLSSVYTPYRSLFSHFYNTPFNTKRQKEVIDYFEQGIQTKFMKATSKIIVQRTKTNQVNRRKILFKNSEYVVYRLPQKID
jgi:hypothetical protein